MAADKGIDGPLKQIARDLMNLEVNTIVKPNMTGRKMPKPRHALVDIAQNYQRKLMQMELWPEDADVFMGSYDGFDLIREQAAIGIKSVRKKKRKEAFSKEEVDELDLDLVMLFRIQKMSDQIKGVFSALKGRNLKAWEKDKAVWENNMSRDDIESRHPPMPLTTDELVLIRKIWEMGLEQIALQTIIQLDGDVLTRIQPKYALENETARTLQSIHSQNVSTSLRFWNQLIGVLRDFITGLARALT